MTWKLASTLPKKALGATLAAALALSTTTAAPVHADEDTVGAIAAASFFVLVAAAVIASSRNDAPPRAVPPRRDPRKTLPAACRFDVSHGPDRGTFYGSRCLVAEFDHWPYLPDRCEARLERPGRHHDVKAYDASCLAHFGYRAAEEPRRAHR